MTETALALLEAHVKHELSRLRDDRLDDLLGEWTTAAFQWLEDVKFDDVVTREQIVGVIDRYVIELQVSGGITELAGQMANVVFSSKASATTRLEQVFRPDDFGEFADKVAALGGVQRELIRFVIESPAFGTLASRMVSRLILDAIFRPGDGGALSRLKERLSALGQQVVPGLERRIGGALSRYMEGRAGRLSRSAEDRVLGALDAETVRAIADEIWDAISKRPLAEAGAFFTAQDLEDFVVLGYEFWLKFRKTPYFRAVSTEVVHHLFAKYGQESVATVIADMGVTQEMLTHELRTFVRPVIDHALQTGFLEQRIRAHLEPFYRSPALARILAR